MLENNNQINGRTIGIWYLVTIGAGIFAESVRGGLIDHDDAVSTAANIVTHASLYRLSLAADLLMLGSYIAVTILLYGLFAPTNRRLSLMATAFSMTGIVVLAVNSLNHVAALMLVESPSYFHTFQSGQSQSLAMFALKLHDSGYDIADAFFGVYCALLGTLILQSRLMPRWLGTLLAFGGLCYLIDSMTTFVLPELSARLPGLASIAGLTELIFTGWLLAFGAKMARQSPLPNSPIQEHA